MTPNRLQSEHFKSYPPEARELAVRHLALLRRLPLAFVPLLLREMIAYDYKFPAERQELDHQVSYLGSMDAQALDAAMLPFAQLRIAPEIERLDWVGVPADFSEQLTAHLWATHQIDNFRTAAVEYVAKLNAAKGTARLTTHRLGVVMIGAGVGVTDYPLFRKLRPRGTYFRRVEPGEGFAFVMRAIEARARAHPAAFAHWHVDGAEAPERTEGLTIVSYTALRRVRASLQTRIQQAYESGTNSEALRTTLARTRPEDLGLGSSVLDRFQMSLLTEGSGTQIFSTSFVQWAAREAWRRAQPRTPLRNAKEAGTGSDGIAGGWRYGCVLHVGQSAKIAGSECSTIPRVVRGT